MFFDNVHVYYLAVIAYLGIFLFGWSRFLSHSLVLLQYTVKREKETGVAGGVVAQKGFLDAFHVKDKKQVSSVVVAILQAGAFFGSLPAPILSNKFGRRKTLFGFNLFIVLGTVLQTIPGVGGKIALIYLGRTVAGFGIGGITSIASGYVSECCPKDVRGRITGMFQVILAAGVMVSYFVNYGVAQRYKSGAQIWRIPFGLQLVPSGLMGVGLLFATESPRWLAKVGRTEEALRNLAFLRRRNIDDEAIIFEMAEINAAIREESAETVSLRYCLFTKGINIRFFITFSLFVLQQWSGQNTVGYYGPQIFKSIGYNGTSAALLASGIYGVVKLAATFIWVMFGVETVGRRWSLFASALGMGILFFIIGALLKTYPPSASSSSPQPASRAMAGLVYLIAVVYSLGVGPLCWVYVSEIFTNSTRHWGLALASATQWLFNFAQAQASPYMIDSLDYKVFFLFGAINVLGFSTFVFFLPETKGRSLEEMDVIFGSVSKGEREAHMRDQQDGLEPGVARYECDEEKRTGSVDEKKDLGVRYGTSTP